MIRLMALIGVAFSIVPGLAVATCEELKQRIADGMTAGGLTGFQLDIVPADQIDQQVDTRKVVGTCEARTKKILYSRTATTGAAAPPSPPRVVAPPASNATAAPLARKPSTQLAPGPRLLMKPGRAAGTLRDPLSEGGEGPAMVVLPAGEFVMGSAQTGVDRRYGEGPEHRVKVRSFAIARTETTFDDFDRFAKATGRRLPDDEGRGRGTQPVVDVSWLDALAYVQWLTAQTGFTYRLPSEAEWEYAARARGRPGAPYSTGDCISAKQANFNDSATPFNDCPASGINLGKAQPVASYPPNAFGLFDMHGNVFEWTADCVHLSYEQAPIDGSAWLQDASGKCSERMVRGGSWQSGQISVRSSLRAGIGYSDPSALIGFRVARDMPQQGR